MIISINLLKWNVCERYKSINKLTEEPIAKLKIEENGRKTSIGINDFSDDINNCSTPQKWCIKLTQSLILAFNFIFVM